MLTVEYPDEGGAREWHLTEDGDVRTEENVDYRPTVYVGGPADALRLVERRVDLRERDPRPALRVELDRVDEVTSFAHEVRYHHEAGSFPPATFRLYNVDFSRQFRYCLETGTEPVPAREQSTTQEKPPESALYIANQPHRLREIKEQWESVGRSFELAVLTLDGF